METARDGYYGVRTKTPALPHKAHLEQVFLAVRPDTQLYGLQLL